MSNLSVFLWPSSVRLRRMERAIRLTLGIPRGYRPVRTVCLLVARSSSVPHLRSHEPRNVLPAHWIGFMRHSRVLTDIGPCGERTSHNVQNSSTNPGRENDNTFWNDRIRHGIVSGSTRPAFRKIKMHTLTVIGILLLATAAIIAVCRRKVK